MRRLFVVAAGLAVCLFWSLPAHANPGNPNPGIGDVIYAPTVDHAKLHGRHGGNPDLYYHGGSIQQSTKIYIDFWGSDWNNTSFSQTAGGYTYTYATATNYITKFFGGVGGTTWIKSDNQYCQSSNTVTVASGSYSCPSGATYITNGSGEYGGSWTDVTTVPNKPSSSDILAEAQRAQSHFGDTSGNATYLVFSPSGKSESGFGTSWCAWHTSNGNLAYGYVPYQPDAGYSCGENFINSDNSFGNGYFDGFSVVGGHEYEEAQTDPYPSGGWLDSGGSEDADKCAWASNSTDISVSGSTFAVQPIWSNAAGGSCVTNGS